MTGSTSRDSVHVTLAALKAQMAFIDHAIKILSTLVPTRNTQARSIRPACCT
jgi:hypothetical protein